MFSVYVDDAVLPYGRMMMCHMVSPDLAALHAMADQIGIDRKWFQDPRTMEVSAPHYDLDMYKRVLAVAAGAVEVDRYQMSVVSNWAKFRLLGREDMDPLALFRSMRSARLPELEAWLRSQGWDGLQ